MLLLTTHRTRATHRPAFSVIELTCAMVLLATTLVLVASTLGALAQHERSVERQALATEEAASAMERLAALPYAELTPEAAARLTLSARGAAKLPGGKLSVSLDNIAESPAAKRVKVEVTWRHVSGEAGRTARLVTWLYAPEERAP